MTLHLMTMAADTCLSRMDQLNESVCNFITRQPMRIVRAPCRGSSRGPSTRPSAGSQSYTFFQGVRLDAQVEVNSMKSPIIGLRVAGVVFALMALAQLVRLIVRPEILVAGYLMPLWPSALAFVLLCVLSAWMWSLGYQ
ncbi:hypothetical protein [Pseudomonas sp. Irchel s3h17]|uniref:hypothetical protein n=1 Tax=Pseudomonas sp. Irchel s3h17 TaxID=2009182 RepID=UPI001C46BE54|nr:hypothetical protein [Pseudomonas sp. Irchel s3h17]